MSLATSAIANQVSGKRKRCDDSHVTESSPLSTRRTQNSSGPMVDQANSWQTDISILPQLDAGILQQVRHLGHYPMDFKQPKTQEQTDERSLASHIRQFVFVFRTRGLQGMARSIAPSPNYLYPQNHVNLRRPLIKQFPTPLWPRKSLTARCRQLNK